MKRTLVVTTLFLATTLPHAAAQATSYMQIPIPALPAFKPQWDAKKGAEQLYKAYRASALTLEEFEGPRYQRIGHINKLLADGILETDLRHRSTGNRTSAAAGTAPLLAGS